MPVTSLGRQDPRPRWIEQTVEAVFETDDFDTGVGRGLDDGADDCVQAGSVAAAGENADFSNSGHVVGL